MNDDRLRNAFHELRRNETANVPSFQQIVERRRPRRRTIRLAFAVMLFFAVALSVVPLLRRSPTPNASITEWRAPTDFLLKTPGNELLTSVPDLKGNIQ